MTLVRRNSRPAPARVRGWLLNRYRSTPRRSPPVPKAPCRWSRQEGWFAASREVLLLPGVPGPRTFAVPFGWMTPAQQYPIHRPAAVQDRPGRRVTAKSRRNGTSLPRIQPVPEGLPACVNAGNTEGHSGRMFDILKAECRNAADFEAGSLRACTIARDFEGTAARYRQAGSFYDGDRQTTIVICVRR